ncbi:MAG TPA: HNH endonuclease domain-containing protein [Ignavibacteria bacterium]|nr:HNH endonuclease domain-containing protein [Ignavibacteria bacterium]
MKHIIGIDAGTNSVGWTLIEEVAKDNVELLDIGTYIFPIGTIVDPTSSKEKTKNEQRREYRGMKRNHFRYKLRRKKLKSLLNSLEMLPDFSRLFKKKGLYQSSESYSLRARAVKEKIHLSEIGRIFMLLNKHRGFKSNSKKLIKSTDEEGVVELGIKNFRNLLINSGSQTIGEYFFKMHENAQLLYKTGKWHNPDELIDERAKDENGEIILYNSRGIRRQFGRYTAREMYQEEFDLIWAKQKEYYEKSHPHIFTGSLYEFNEIKNKKYNEKLIEIKKFKDTNYWKIRNYCIYYQRPLRSQKKYLSKCQFEKNKKVIPASSPLFQEFRIWKNLSDLRYSLEENNIINEPLPLEWKITISDFLQTNEKIFIEKPKKKRKDEKKTYIIDLLINTNPSIRFITEDEEAEKLIKGNLTYFAFFEALGKEEFEKIKVENRLEQLWHHIYMSKDDDWLKDVLLYKWKFNEDAVNKLIDFGLENDYGSYSSKVIKKILPFMKKGKDEYNAQILGGYLKSSDEDKDVVKLKNRITQLKYQELRNPVVEKSISKVIKIVNAILDKYDNIINRENLEIRIESTRELKKPRKEREKILRQNRDKDKERQEYANFLNSMKENGKLNFNRRIEKYDTIIKKFELWLEMKMDKDDPNFSKFEKIVKKGDFEKHKLWLECNRICPYTSRVISLTSLFSPEIEIEHIIPLSRSLDDSFNNKTLTFSDVNKEKGNRTSFEYMSWKNDLENFKKRIKYFSESKRNQFLLSSEKADNKFSNDQLGNTGYINKYIRKKMLEICKSNNVIFTNGFSTAQLRNYDWKLNDLLDKIRFEEETGIDIEKYLILFVTFRKDFINWYKMIYDVKEEWVNLKKLSLEIFSKYDSEKNQNMLECMTFINKYEEFRNLSGKKDRSDHRHHAIDSFITACCSRSITQFLSNSNRQREGNGISFFDDYGNINRELINRPFDYDELKNKIKEILVVHDASQKLILSNTNKYKTREGIKKQKVYSPQGALHKDGIYGKLKEPLNQGLEKQDVYVKRIPLVFEKEVAFKKKEDLKKIYDKNVKLILEKRIEKYGSGEQAFSKEAMEKDPIYLYSLKEYPDGSKISKKGMALPIIKNVRVINKNSNNLVQLLAKDENKKIVNQNRYAETDGNYLMVLYKHIKKEKNGKINDIRDFRLLSFFEAVEKKRKKERLYQDIIEKNELYLQLMDGCHWLKQGDMVVLYNNSLEFSKINWNNNLEISKILFKVRELGIDTREKSKYAVIKLEKHNLQKTSGQKYSSKGNFLKLSQTINAIKVRFSSLGEIELIGNDCFIK